MPPRREQLNQSEPMTQEQKERLTRLLRGTKLTDEERDKFFKVLNREKANDCINVITRYKKDEIIVIEQLGLDKQTGRPASMVRQQKAKEFFGKPIYLFLEIVTKGGQSEISVGIDLLDGLPVAFKSVKPKYETREDLQLRLEHEGRIQRQNKNDHIIEVKNILNINKYHALVMEFMDPKNSYSLDQMPSVLPYWRIVQMIREVGEGLKNLHARNTFHRDLKPGNILFNGKSFQVGDFGNLTEIAESAGYTPNYTAPELSKSGKSSMASETFAMGLVMYYCMTGERFYGLGIEDMTLGPQDKANYIANEINTTDVVARLVHSKKLRAYFPDGDRGDRIFNEVVTVLARSIAKTPYQRYQSFDALADDFEKACNTK